MNSFHLGRLAATNATRFADKLALKYKDKVSGDWKGIDWQTISKYVNEASLALIAMGVKVQDKVAIYSQNMVEMMVVDLALQQIRAVAVPLYATASADQVEYIVRDAACELMFVGEQYQYDQAIKVLHSSDCLKRIVTIDKDINLNGVDATIMFADFLKYGNDEATRMEFDSRQASLSQDDIATLIYTSGTSGEPKGVILKQSNYTAQMYNHEQMLTQCDETLTSMMFLPASHIFERAWDYFCMYKGMLIYVNTNPKEITDAIKETRPHAMCAVPRFWEKVYAGIQAKIEKFPFLTRSLMLHAIKVGRKRNLDYARLGKSAPLLTELQYTIFQKTLFRTVKRVLGLENSVIFPVAGSQLSEQVNEFLQSISLPIVYGYGLTESTATVSCYQPGKMFEVASVGQVVPGLEVKIGENDEILLRGESITCGYYNKPEVNAEAFIDGWFRTGDAGKIVGENIYVTERIKDLFKTSNGKYIAPQQIENLLVADKYIDQCAVIGDQRKFVTALIVPDFAALREYADMNMIKYADNEELIKNEKIVSFFEGRVKGLQKSLAAYEQVKRFTLLVRPFTSDTGELTLTLKLKRKVINANYADAIEYMYSY